MEARRRTSEVQLLRDGDEVSQVPEFEVTIHIDNIIIVTNKILDVLVGRN